MKKLDSLSVFFPVFNEEKNLEPLIDQALRIVPKFAKKFELIIVNDGSVDGSENIARRLAAKNPEVRVLGHEKNRGYGAALKSGLAASRLEWIFFTDADLQFDLNELANLLPFTDKYQAILGFRKNRAEGFGRRRNAWLFKLFIDLLFRLHVKDIDAAFKLLRADAIKPIKLEADGAFISAEMLYKLKKNQIKFKQVPVSHYPRVWGNPTGANWKVAIKAGYEALNLYWHIKLSRLKHHQW